MTLVHREHETTALLERLSALEIRAIGLEAMVGVLQAENAALRETIAQLQAVAATVDQLQAENAELRELLAIREALIRKLQALHFGKKSEKGANAPKTDPPPTDAEASDDASAPAPEPPGEQAPTPETSPAAETTAKRPRGQQRGAPGHGRRLYEELPPRVVLHTLPEEERCCPHCGGSYAPCGTEDSIEVEWEVIIRRVIHQREKYVSTCACQSVVLCTTPAPPKLIPRGLLAESTIANLVVNKYLHGQPIHRQLHAVALHSGVRLAPGTLVGVLDTVGELLRPLYTAFLLHLRTAEHWHADETRWLQFGDERHHRWWLWVFASADTVIFVLDPTRSRAVPRRVFGLDAACWGDDPDAPEHQTACGDLTCDRLKSYQGISGIQTTYCWAHVRRDFKDLATGYPAVLGPWAWTWVERIGTLYHLTDQRKLCEPGTEAFRQADAALRDHVEQIAHVRDAELADSRLLQDARKALESLRRHWDGLLVFLDHPEVPLDNNEAERLLRTGVVGRKNFYGSGSYTNGDLVECAYTVLLTAATNGLNPLTYLRAYLDACAANDGQPPVNIERFLPWKASKEDLATWQLPPKAN